jgi:hypothetical protein
MTNQDIARCYLLYNKLNKSAVNIPIGTVVATVATGCARALEKSVNSDEAAEQIINNFLPAKSNWNLLAGELEEELQETAHLEKAKNGTPRQTTTADKPVQLTGLQSVKDTMIFKCHICNQYKPAIEMFNPVGDFEKDTCNLCIGEPVDKEAFAAKRAALMAMVEEEVDEIKTAEEIDLLSRVSLGRIERTSPDTEPVQAPRSVPPWELAAMLTEAEVSGTKMYQAAGDDETIKLAIRATYAGLPKDMWDSEKALELVKKATVYFMRWIEEMK